MYSDEHCPNGQVISLANRWKKYIDNITPPLQAASVSEPPSQRKDK